VINAFQVCPTTENRGSYPKMLSVTPESSIEKAINGIDDMVYVRTLEELESWRDGRLISLYKLLWDQKN